MNPELIIWDYGKEITVTLEDALYTPSSMGMLWSGKHGLKKTKLYGTLRVEILDESDKQEQTIEDNAIITLDTYNDFAYYKKPSDSKNICICTTIGESRLNMTGYEWISNIKISTINSLEQYNFNSVKFMYTISSKLNDAVPTHRYFVLNSDSEYSECAVDWGGSVLDEDKLQYKEVLLKEIELDNGKTKKIYFTLDKNNNNDVPEEVVYQIEHGLNSVKYLERIEKCKATQTFAIDTSINLKHGNYRYLSKYSEKELTVFIDPKTMLPYEPNAESFTRKNGESVKGDLRIIKQHEIYYKWTRTKATDYTSLGRQIIVDPIHFPGCYRLVGETYSRNRNTGKDQRFQFEIPLCKIGSENNLTLEAEGDPTTFNMTLKVLRREDGVMMKLTQYDVETAKYDGYLSGSTNIVKTGDIEEPEIDPNKTVTEWRFETYITEDNVLSTLSLDITQNNFTVTNTLSNVDENVDGFLTAAEEKEYRIYRRERKYINNEPTEDTRDIYVRTAISTTPLDPNEYILNLNSLE